MRQQPGPGRLPKPAPGSVSPHGAPHLPAHRDSDPPVPALPRARESDQGAGGVDPLPLQDALEVAAPSNALPPLHPGEGADQADVSRCRPLRLRLRSIRRPAGELIFRKKPCTRRRYRFLGW
jgi:hypothetical protein